MPLYGINVPLYGINVALYGIIGAVSKLLASEPVCFGCFQLHWGIYRQMAFNHSVIEHVTDLYYKSLFIYISPPHTRTVRVGDKIGL